MFDTNTDIDIRRRKQRLNELSASIKQVAAILSAIKVAGLTEVPKIDAAIDTLYALADSTRTIR